MEYQVREPELAEYLRLVRNLERKFQGFTVTHIPRAENELTDALAKVVAQGTPLPLEVFYHVAISPTIETEGTGVLKEVVTIHSEDRRSLITMFLEQGYVPKDHMEMHRLQ